MYIGQIDVILSSNNSKTIYVIFQFKNCVLFCNRLLSPDCQMMFFSATYDEEVMEFAEAIVTNPVTIRLKREEESLDNIKQYYVMCKSQEDKYTAIANIYGVVTIGQAMIFCHVSI